MKHINLSNGWEFGIEPFPAWRCSLVFGRNKRDREFLPCNVKPNKTYTVIYEGKEIYRSNDKIEAEEIKDKNQYAYAYINEGLSTLTENEFKVIKTKEKGTIMIVSGEDRSAKCLLFVGLRGGFRGGVTLLEKDTTGNVLKICKAENACESSIEVIVILDVNDCVVFHSYGRRSNEIYVYTWTGLELITKHYSKEEYMYKSEGVEEKDVIIL
jgi:hypothetical protein